MTSDQPEAPPGTSGEPGQLPFDTSIAHQARMYDYLLGGKDNISQEVRLSRSQGASTVVKAGQAT